LLWLFWRWNLTGMSEPLPPGFLSLALQIKLAPSASWVLGLQIYATMLAFSITF
jgi:hypothetical protein